MSYLQKLLAKACEGKDLQEKVYGRFPFEIAPECGPEEVLVETEATGTHRIINPSSSFCGIKLAEITSVNTSTY